MKKTMKLTGLILGAGLMGLTSAASAQNLRPAFPNKIDRTKLERPQLKRMKNKGQRFAKLDANKDGRLSQTEFANAKRNRLKARLYKMDSNGDGVLSKDELANRRMKRKARKANHDRKMDRRAKKARRAKKPGMMDKRLRKADLNRDGKLQLTELIRFKSKRMNKRLDKRFTKLDVNKDGYVTKDELQKMRKDKRKLRKGKKARKLRNRGA